MISAPVSPLVPPGALAPPAVAVMARHVEEATPSLIVKTEAVRVTLAPVHDVVLPMAIAASPMPIVANAGNEKKPTTSRSGRAIKAKVMDEWDVS